MELIEIICPHCGGATQLGHACQECSADLRPLLGLNNLALAHYNQALEHIRAENWELAWSEASSALKIFPALPEAAWLALRLARELGYFDQARQILDHLKPQLEEAEFARLKGQVEDEAWRYNLLVLAPGAAPQGNDLLVHRRLRELQDPNKAPEAREGAKPPRAWLPYLAALPALLLLSGSLWLSHRYLISLESIRAKDNLVKELQARLSDHSHKEEKQPDSPTADRLVQTIRTNPAAFSRLSEQERHQAAKTLHAQGEYALLSGLGHDSWYGESAGFLLIWDRYKRSLSDPDLAPTAMKELDAWTAAHPDFPSYFGDACLALLNYYGAQADPEKQREIALRLKNWVGRMPQTSEYKQYLNTKVWRIING